jgi:hypothetical protein
MLTLPRRGRALFLALVPLVIGLALIQAPSGPAAEPAFELKPGDHVCLIGNTLADRMQHDGWLEALLHATFPKHDLTIRNLGYSGDELTLRLRSMDFGTPDQWLSGSAPIPQPNKLSPRPGQPLRADQHPGGRRLRLLRLQRELRRRGRPAEVQERPRRLHQAHPRPEVQRHVGAATRPLLTHCP